MRTYDHLDLEDPPALAGHATPKSYVDELVIPLFTELTSLYITADHVIRKALGGSFTPVGTRAIIEVGLSARMEGVAHQSVMFAWNQDVAEGADLLTGESFTTGNQYVTGTSYRNCGPAVSPGSAGDAHRRFLITGLTPGTPVTWEVDIGATGYRENLTGGFDFPVAMAFGKGSDRAYVTWYNSGLLVQYDAGTRWSVDGESTILNEWKVDTPYGVATNPNDDSVVYVANNGAGTVLELDAETGATLRTFSIPESPLYMAVSYDGTKLFVGAGGGGSTSVYPVTLSSGTVGSVINVGAYGGQQKIRPAGDYMIVPCTTGERVDRITVADNSVTSLASPVTGQQPAGVAAQKDAANPATCWAAFTNPAEAREIDLATMTYTGETIPDSAIDGSPQDIAVSPTGRSLMIPTTNQAFQSYALPSVGVRYEYGVGYGFVTELDRYGGAWVIERNADQISHWHGSHAKIDPADDFWGSHLDVLVEQRP